MADSTENIEELDIGTIPSQQGENQRVIFEPFGTAVTADEIRARLSTSLYKQLSENSDDTVLRAVNRAEIRASAIFRYLSVPFNLDDTTQREIVLILSIYELHIALGHEEAGREYRILARDMIIAAYGKYPDSEDDSTPAIQAGTLAVQAKEKRRFGSYRHALDLM